MNTEYLIESRRKKGYSQKDISEILNVHESTICLWEKGKRNPKMELIIKLCKLLNMDSNILLGINNGGEHEEI